MPEMTYAKSGVNIDREELAIKGIKKWCKKSFNFRKGKIGEVMGDVGLFANLLDMGDFALAICTDGVGSKVLVAQELNKYDSLGIDLIAMNVNDLICCGAEPIAMVDYIAFKQVDPEITREISIGIYEGAKIAEISVVGGETATLPEIITGVGNKGFDLAGSAIGVVNKEKIINPKNISPGDVVLGFRSSGVHSNGLTLARKVLPRNMWVDLIIPTRIYVKEVMELVKEFDIHGLAHITGGGFRNLQRLTDFGFYLDKLPTPQMIFRKIQELGDISDKEMYKTFNMGIGFCVIVNEKDLERIVQRYGNDITVIGHVTEEKGVKILKEGNEITL